MKILVIFPKDSESLFSGLNKTFGGASVQMFNYAKELTKHVETFSILPYFVNPDIDKINQVNGFQIYKNSDSIIKKGLALIMFILKHKPDVIVQHGLTYFTLLLSIFCIFFKVRFVFMFAHDLEVEGRFQSNGKKMYFFALLLKTANLLVTQNKYQYSFLKELKIKSVRINNGFEIPDINLERKNNILWVARCEDWKNPELYLKLVEKNPDYHFVMVCPKVNLNYFSQIKNQAFRYKNLDFLEFVDFKDINSYFVNAKIFVNTSVHEGFPQTFIQATMNSVPILSMTVDPDEIIKNNNLGFVCNSNFELLNKNLQLLMHDKSLLNLLSKNAHKYASMNHSISNNVSLLLNCL